MRKNQKEAIISYDSSIKKSNSFVLAKLNQGLSLNQMQLLAYAIYSTQKNGVTVFNKVDLEKKFSMTQYRTDQAKKDAAKLSQLQFSEEDIEQNSFKFNNIFQDIEYKKGVFEFVWSNKMLPHILDLKEKHILTDLNITSQFKSSFTWTLYEFLKANYGYSYKIMSKASLMGLFGVEGKKAYNNTSAFKRVVLDVAIEEINRFTEINVSYEDIKKGRAIDAFKISWSTGTTISHATDKQLELLRNNISEIMRKQLDFTEINDNEILSDSVSLIRETKEFLPEIEPGAIVKTERADLLIKRTSQILNELEILMERDERGSKPKVEFYNWLEERE